MTLFKTSSCHYLPFRALILLRGIKKVVDIIEGRLPLPTPLAAEATDVQRKTSEKDLEIFSTAEVMALHVFIQYVP